MTLLKEPSAIKIGLTLFLVSTIIGFIINSEMSVVVIVISFIPAILTGLYFASQSGKYISPRTRWSASIIWFALTFISNIVFYSYDEPLFDTLATIYQLGWLGWYSLILLAAFIVFFLISYFVFKIGEKMGIKFFLLENTKLTN